MDPVVESCSPPTRFGSVPGPYASLLSSELKSAGGEDLGWLWDGYLRRGEMTLLTSLWKSGKSTLVSLLLARMKTGGMLGGRAVQPGKVVVVSEESPSQWYDRDTLLAFGEHVCWFCRPFLGKPRPADWLALLDQIGRIRDRDGVDLVVIDPLANLSPLRSENDAGEMLNTLLPLQRLTARGMGALVNHHPRKGPIIPGQAARGSGALSGFVDIIVEMQAVSPRYEHDRRRRLRAFSRHSATPPSWVMELNAEGTDYIALGPTAEPDFEHGWPVLKAVLEQAERPLTRRALRRAWPPGHVPPAAQTLWSWLRRAVRERLVLQHGEGTRKEPFVYHLPGKMEQWQAAALADLMKRLDEPAEPAVPRVS